MKKFIYIIALITLGYGINNNYICEAHYTKKSLFGKTIVNIKRKINFKKSKINLIDEINISICPKKFFIIGDYICKPQYKGKLKIISDYQIHKNEIILNSHNKKFKINDDLRFKQKIEEERGYNNCNNQGKLAKYCYKSKNVFEKHWNNKRKEIQSYAKENIILYITNHSLKDKTLNINFKCK